MHCERAHELFSDYLERTLDRPMTLALDAHLGSCAGCRDEVESLQETMLALDAVPDVDPPWDGAWQVMSRIRNVRAEQLEVQRRKSVPFLDWLRGLSPARAAMGASLATLVIAGTAMIPGVPGLIRNAVFGAPPVQQVTRPTGDAPTVQATYVPASQHPQINLTVNSSSEISAARVRLTGGGRELEIIDNYGLGPSTPLVLPVILQNTASEAEAMQMTVISPTQGQEYRYLIAVPLKARQDNRVTLMLQDRRLDETLRQLVPYLGRPVIVSGVAADRTVDLRAVGGEARRCLEDVALQIGAKLTVQSDGYHLNPAP